VMKRKRSSTVEPVWGTLINFMGMKRMNARGLAAANKVLILASACYNLKKWLRFISPKSNIKTMAILEKNVREAFTRIKNIFIRLITRQNEALCFLPVRNS
jgi:Transposase DDE domain